MKKISILALFILFIPVAFVWNQNSAIQLDPYSPALVLGFAEELSAQGEIQESIWEYQRYLFLTKTPEERSIIKLAELYKIQGEYEQAISHIDRYSYAITNQENIHRLFILKGYTLFQLRNWPALDSFLLSSEIQKSDNGAFQALRISSLIYQQKYSEAQGLSRNLLDPAIMGNLTQLLNDYRRKSPTLATALSTFIPGLGKAYAGQFGDALFSFLSVTLLSSFAVYSYTQEGPQSWRPWVYGITGGVFYSANLYGSYQAALRFNTVQDKKLKKAADDLVEKYQK